MISITNKFKNKLETFIPDELPELIKPHIEIYSKNKAIVEGCKGILQYTCNYVRLNCKTVIISFSGTDLSLCNLNEETITVTGCISDINII